MLERNADLKLLMLDQTPWVQAAKSNTSRMAALAQLLDPEAADKAIADGITASAPCRTPTEVSAGYHGRMNLRHGLPKTCLSPSA